MIINSRFFNRSELIGFVTLALLLFVILPLTLDVFRLNLVAKYLTYAFVAIGLVLCWGYGGILSLGQGVFFGLGGYCMAMYLKLEASSVANTKIQSTPGHSRLHGLESDHATAVVLETVPQFPVHAARDPPGAGVLRLHHRRRDVQAPGRRRLFRDHHPGDRRHSDHPDRRPAGLYRRHQRHHRPAHPARLGHPHRPRQVHPVFRRGRPAVRLHRARRSSSA